MGLCLKCGESIQDDAKFCTGCGTSVSQTISSSEINTRQRRILMAVAVAIAAMMLFPPFYFHIPKPRLLAADVRHGYGWLLSHGAGRVDVELLLVQLLVVGVMGLIAYVLCADKRQ